MTIRLSPHFTLDELTVTDQDLPNVPNEHQIANLQLLCTKVLEPLRTRLGKPIHVNSGYRSPEVNKAVGGSKSSHHMLGCAADVRVDGEHPGDLLDALVSLHPAVRWTQAIREPTWLHVSYIPDNLRCEKLSFDGKSYRTLK